VAHLPANLGGVCSACSYLHDRLHANKAPLPKNGVPCHTAFSGSRLENESHPRISTCLWKWTEDSRMDAGGQCRDEPARGLELRNEARSLSQSSRRNRLGTPLRLDSWRVAQPWAGIGAAACDMVLGGWSRGAGTRGQGSVTRRSFWRGTVDRSLRLRQNTSLAEGCLLDQRYQSQLLID
jgi:hypothetical protein